MNNMIRANKDSRLYVIQTKHGYTCLGFDVCESRTRKLALELEGRGKSVGKMARKGTPKAYQHYLDLVELARQENVATGWRSNSDLTPELIGLEGKRVEVVTEWGEKRRFYVGKSTGFIPCHLEIATRRSTGGPGVSIGKPRSVKVVG